jgi:multicomponent Na+:H+ antiporter subunit D
MSGMASIGFFAVDVTAPGSGGFDALIPLSVILPLVAAGLSVGFAHFRNVQRVISVVALLGLVANNVLLFARIDEGAGDATGGIAVSQAGGWVAPLGISLVVDRLAAMMLLVSSLMLVSVLVYAIGQHAEERRFASFHPVYLVLAGGVSGSFITGDLFNLFVAFEMMLVSSYVLLTLGGRAGQVRSGMSYVVISLIASTFFITALALLYSATGTVNMAELAERMPELSSGVRVGFSLLLIAVFGIKAGIFPLHRTRSQRSSLGCSPRLASTQLFVRSCCSSRPMRSRGRSSLSSPVARCSSACLVRFRTTTFSASCRFILSATSAT